MWIEGAAFPVVSFATCVLEGFGEDVLHGESNQKVNGLCFSIVRKGK